MTAFSALTGWAIIGGWLLLSIIVGLFLGAVIKLGDGDE